MKYTKRKPTIRSKSRSGRSKPPWEKMYDELVKYKKKYKDCNVPTKWSKNIKLGRWVSHQRNMAGKGLLSEERFKRLADLGFTFNMHNTSWDNHYESLKKYKHNTGHCNVPEQWNEFDGLGGWVHSQRTRWKKGRLEKERIEKLEDIGFIWERHNTAWNEKFDKLVEFKKRYGHCDVPPGWPGHPKLAEWTYQQRKHKKNGKMPNERIKRMEKIGFKWTLKEY